MGKRYFVKANTSFLALGDANPYAQAVLNHVQYKTELNGNILIAALGTTEARLKKYYQRGINQYQLALPTLEINTIEPKLETDVITYLAQKYTGIPQAEINITSIATVNAGTASPIFRMKAYICENYLGGTPTYPKGFHEAANLVVNNINNVDVDPNDNTRPLRPVPLYNDRTAFLEEVNTQWPNALNDNKPTWLQISEPAPLTTYSTYTSSFTEHKLIYDSSVVPAVLSSQEVSNIDYSVDDGDVHFLSNDDWLVLVKFKDNRKSEQEIYAVIDLNDPNALAIFPPSSLIQVDTAYPVLPLKKDFQSIVDVYNPTQLADLKKQYEILNIGKLGDMLDQVANSSPEQADIRDVFLTGSVDLYAGNIYVFEFWKNIITIGGNSLNNNQGAKDINSLRIIEDMYEQYLIFRKTEINILAVDADFAEPNYEYTIFFELPAEYLNEEEPLNLAGHWVDSNNNGSTWVDNASEYEQGPEELKIMDIISRRVVVLEKREITTNTVTEILKIHGLVNASHIKSGTDKYWHVSYAKSEDLILAQARKAADETETEYVGESHDALPLMLVQSTLNNIEVYKKRPIYPRSLAITFYGSKVTYTTWWQDLLSFVLEIYKLVAIVISIATMGASIQVAIEAQALSELMWKIGLDFLKGELTKIIVKEIGGENAAILLQAYNLSQADLGDFDITDMSTYGELIDNIEIKDVFAAVTEIGKGILYDEMALTSLALNEDTKKIITDEQDATLVETSEEFIERTTHLPSAKDIENAEDTYGIMNSEKIDVLFSDVNDI